MVMRYLTAEWYGGRLDSDADQDRCVDVTLRSHCSAFHSRYYGSSRTVAAMV